jgi:hypothetical protein
MNWMPPSRIDSMALNFYFIILWTYGRFYVPCSCTISVQYFLCSFHNDSKASESFYTAPNTVCNIFILHILAKYQYDLPSIKFTGFEICLLHALRGLSWYPYLSAHCVLESTDTKFNLLYFSCAEKYLQFIELHVFNF